MQETINFIGCGRVGKTLAKLFVEKQTAKINAILTSSASSAQSVIETIGQGSVCHSMKELPDATIYFIATPDEQIEATCQQLINAKKLGHKTIVAHFSGALSSDVLLAAKQAGCDIASIHPLKSFAEPEENIKNFSGTHCSIEGDKHATDILRNLFETIGAIVFDIESSAKDLYHAASVMANNYLVCLHYYAMQNYIKSGIDKNTAKKIVSNLMQDGLSNLATLDHQLALTGPIQRGDLAIIERHQSALEDNPVAKDLYRELGLATLELTAHDQALIEAFQQALKE